MTYISFENLDVWKRSCRLAVDICNLLNDCSNFVLKDQMGRAAISIASNVAEGAERGSRTEFIRFLHIAKGSAAELRTQIYIADKLGNIVPKGKSSEFISELRQISSMLHGLIKSQKG